jgi:hypothetical protein
VQSASSPGDNTATAGWVNNTPSQSVLHCRSLLVCRAVVEYGHVGYASGWWWAGWHWHGYTVESSSTLPEIMTRLGSPRYMWYSRCSNGYGTELTVNYQPATAAVSLTVLADDNEKAPQDDWTWECCSVMTNYQSSMSIYAWMCWFYKQDIHLVPRKC